MRLTFLAVNCSHSHASLALPCLHAAAQAAAPEWEWRAVAGVTADPPGVLAAQAAESAPDVVAATVYLFNRAAVFAVLRRVKALLPACRILLGGPEFLGDNRALLQAEPWIDAVVRGEGEPAIGPWLASLDRPAAWPAIPGLCWRDAAGNGHDNGLALLAADAWAALPPPHSSPFFAHDRPFAQLETVRGCPHACAFCTSARTGPPRYLPLDRVAADLAALYRRGLRDFRLIDRTFNADPRRTVALLRLFRETYADGHFHLEWHPAGLAAAVRDALGAAPAGQLHLEVGLQTTVTAALRACQRRETPARAWENLAVLCGLRNLAVHVDLLAGLPETTPDTVAADLDRLLRLGPAEIQLETLKLLPGTPLADHAAGLGLAYAPDPPYEVLRTPQWTPGDLGAARDLSRLVDLYVNAPRLHDAGRAAAAAQPDFCRRFQHWLTARGHDFAPAGLDTRLRRLHDYARESGLEEAAALLERAWL
ncbi:MAG: radical SAM protein, partial [Lentisphaeria bacterium]